MTHLITLDDPRDFIVWREGMGRTVEIFDIAVGSERRKGKGRELILKMLRTVGTMPEATRPSMVYALTRISNSIAHQFYEALGFRLVGRLHYFYRDSGDDLEHCLCYGKDI